MTKPCYICDRIEKIKQNDNPFFVTELKTGYVVMGFHQYFRGYTLFMCKEHKNELHELEPSFRLEFLKEMSDVAAAVYRAFKPKKMNYELLGNEESHMHWHLIPRYGTDPVPGDSIWSLDKKTLDEYTISSDSPELEELKTLLKKELSK